MTRLIRSLEKRENAEVWYDKRRIGGADIWREEIANAIDQANIAILLVSQYFLISDFIMQEELPRLVKRAADKQLVIFPILVGYCDWESVDALSRPQMMPGEPTPLVEYLEPLAKWERVQHDILQALLRQIEKLKNERKGPEPVLQHRPEPPMPLGDLAQAVVQPQVAELAEAPLPRDGPVVFDPDRILYLTNGISFAVGAMDSKERSFAYPAGTSLQYSRKGMERGILWYQFQGAGGKDMWTHGYSVWADANDPRVFFKIAETGHLGYLVRISAGRESLYSDTAKIDIADDELGDVEVSSDQVISITAKQGGMLVRTRDIGTFTGGLQNAANYNDPSFTMGPCLVTCDAVIALVRTRRPHPLTLNRITEVERPSLIPELIYCDRSQLRFRLSSTGRVGHFDERVRDSHIHFAEQSLGWMRISIPQIRKLTVDWECGEALVVVETFTGNVYHGACPDQFNLSGTMISFDKVKKNLVLEAFDREAT
jgi:hypothetical protein